jgi:hypothetical protein
LEQAPLRRGFCLAWLLRPSDAAPQNVPGFAYDLRAWRALFRPPTGHVFRVERGRGPVWYSKYRLPDGRQVQRKIGPA